MQHLDEAISVVVETLLLIPGFRHHSQRIKIIYIYIIIWNKIILFVEQKNVIYH